jgi:hypothetical protein
VESKNKENDLEHIGIIRRSGRYPWGSGGTPYQRSKDFKAILEDLRSQGLSDTQIATSLGIKTTELRANISSSTAIIFAENQAMAQRLATKNGGMSTRAIAERMLGDASKESTVRGWLKTANDINEKSLQSISNTLKEHQAEKTWVDVGKGNELYLGISDTKLRTALAVLKDEGYQVHLVKVPQLGTDKLTEHKILGPPDSAWKEAKSAVDAGVVYTIRDKSLDGGLTFLKPKPDPVSVDSKRIEVRYKEDGGDKMDGVIEIRRGMSDLNLGANRYAQVRVAVDGTHYLKGMAMYADDLPAGTDIRFNSPKTRAEAPNKVDTMKPLKEGKENAGNRFGAITHPHVYKDSKGVEHTSPLNMVNEEGDWDKWSRSLSSQFLSKQSVKLASTQLTKAQASKQEKLDEIMALTNPVVKKQMLLEFAESADSAAVSLKAASLPRQSSHVILPMNSMRPDEIYAPNFNNGEKVVLIRHPHGGPFEIPELTVNNNNRIAKRLMGGATDAVGIHHSVAHQLSGADFDGDSVLVIPNGSRKIKTRPPLEELKDFDPKTAYPEAKGMTYMTKVNTQKEMGKISNLITDMDIKGANSSEIARAIKHSMVVIDAEKKNLDYKRSEKDNGIAQLKAKYQDGANRGAATIISRSGAEARPPQRRLRRQSEGGYIDPKTGELRYVDTNRMRPVTKTNKRTGETVTTMVPLTSKTTKMDLAKDANSLVSVPGEPIERVYAAHANTMKALANQARKSAVSIKDPPQSKAAKAYYAKEVASLKAKLKEAQMNAPLERRAQIVGNATAKARISTRPDLDKDEIKKIKYESLRDARIQTGAAKQRIGSKNVPLTQREWDAIQAGAIASSVLREILNNSEMDTIKKYATPKYRSSLTPGQLARIKSMSSSGRSSAEISEALGIPRSTIVDNLKAT